MDNNEELTLFDTEETGKQEPLIEQPATEQEQEPVAAEISQDIIEMVNAINNSPLIQQLAQFSKINKTLTQPLADISKAMTETQQKFSKFTQVFTDSPFLKAFEQITIAAKSLQQDFISLGVSSAKITDAVQLFPDEIQEAFIDILNLARQNIDKGLLLKDYADAINPDLTVKEDFPLKKELEKILESAAEDIEAYRQLKAAEARNKIIAEKREKAIQERIRAIEAGAIILEDKHLATFSSKELGSSLTSNCIKYLDADAAQFDETGRLIDPNVAFNELFTGHYAFLMFFCSALKQKLVDNENTIQVQGKDATVKIYLPNAFKFLSLDPRQYAALRGDNEDIKQLRVEMFKEKILPFEKFVGCLPNGSYYRVLLFKGYDSKTDSILIESPYIYKLYEIENNKKYYLSLNELLHSNLAGEPSAAIEFAVAILNSLKQRGLHKDTQQLQLTKRTTKTRGKTVIENYSTVEADQVEAQAITFRANWRNFIQEKCPQLAAKLDAVMTSDKKNKAMYFNKILADTVKVAYRIIKYKSDAFQYYKGLTFEPCYTDGELKAPTKSQLANTNLVVKHKGKNPNYNLN